MATDDHRMREALARFPDEISQEIPNNLPLLDEYRHRRRVDLRDIEVLKIQHTLAPYVPRLAALFDDGLDPEKTWLVDIPYSTSEDVREQITRRFPIPKSHIAPPFRDPLAPYALVQKRRVQDAIYRLAGHSSRTLLVVDDGAYFVRALADLAVQDPAIYEPFRGRTAIVEQTTRGHRYLEEPEYRAVVEERLQAPAVSIARCKTKVGFEGPFIGLFVSCFEPHGHGPRARSRAWNP